MNKQWNWPDHERRTYTQSLNYLLDCERRWREIDLDQARLVRLYRLRFEREQKRHA